ncbi:MAG: peptide ABC transporter substrate-binding protein [Planctomycetales bacterium]|nr:peptide ABC transporter substrate-binding protein [Planctomycetales bacterium]
MSRRLIITLVLLLALLGGEAWIVKNGRLPPADFSFSNETEIKSLDPAIVAGVPENRIMNAIHEGLVRMGPRMEVMPGVAEHWDVSDDGLTYTFHLRRDAKWSNGQPVTARDFEYSMRRVLDPVTASEYAYQAWYLVGAEDYTKPSQALAPGKKVEIELHRPPAGAPQHARGEVLRGELTAIEIDPDAGERADDPAEFFKTRTFVVDIDGKPRRFRASARGRAAGEAEACNQILTDFSTVGYRALDDHTVEMNLKSRTQYWLQLVGSYTFAAVHQPTIEKHGAPQWTYPENIVTNGPYRVQFRRLRDRIRLVKNTRHWDRDNVAIGTIDAMAVGSDITSFNLYETGQIDWVTKVEPLVSQSLMEDDPPRPDFNPAPMFTSYYYEFSVNRPPLDDRRVRAALNMAIDKAVICDYVTKGGQKPARSFVPPGLPGYEASLCGPHDLEAAKALLAEAGYPGGRGFPTLTILYNTNEGHRDIAEVIQQQWKELGVNIELKNVAWGVFLDFTKQGKYDIARAGWIGDYPDPNTFLDMFVTGGANNQTNWSNKQYDALIEAAKSEPDAAKRLKLFHDAEAILMDNWEAVGDPQIAAQLAELRAADPHAGGQAIIPIYYYVSINMVRPYVQGVAPFDRFDTGFFGNIQDIHPLHIMRIDHDQKRRLLQEKGLH